MKAGDFLFVSWQLTINPKTGEFPEGGVKEQAHQGFKNIKSILADAGFNFTNVVKKSYY
ncbi:MULTISPECIES: Rid family hydrolase [Lysinibacillus]|uniref:Rid family hydrolase n=1 Tax=Lysinibacillus irui TaxID=2998077 RepID=A0AAJ5UTF9_9BACI|nr:MULTISPECIES: Rid family hydrolase [Lysinibacillus]MEA0562076.1 Rid family hydrolase [Lysinibacillus irui]WDV09011.1 Rid family hydrolase [Lysinibacillus irui]